ncbi:MAG: ABC transporter substrate binding protein, partial [Candidatus Nitrotoga sp.]
ITALLDVTSSAKVPVFAVDESSVEKGAIAGLSVNYAEFGKETARVTMRILKGEKPEAIPMSRYLAKDILINQLTAKNIGLNIPPNVVARAVRVIQ